MKLEINKYGKRWRNKKGQLHRENGPAIIYSNGSMFWCLNGLSHRIDGPAAVYISGTKDWWLNDYHVRKFEYD